MFLKTPNKFVCLHKDEDLKKKLPRQKVELTKRWNKGLHMIFIGKFELYQDSALKFYYRGIFLSIPIRYSVYAHFTTTLVHGIASKKNIKTFSRSSKQLPK